MPPTTARAASDNLAQTHAAKQFLAHIKIDNDDARVWAGDGARVWVIDDDGAIVLDIALGQVPRREAISQLLAAVGFNTDLLGTFTPGSTGANPTSC